jgi:hypothetical protein
MRKIEPCLVEDRLEERSEAGKPVYSWRWQHRVVGGLEDKELGWQHPWQGHGGKMMKEGG